MVISNRQVKLGAFWAVLSDPYTKVSSNLLLLLVDFDALELQASTAWSAKGFTIAKKKNTSLAATNRLNQAKWLLQQDPTSKLTISPIQIELIWQDKQKIKVTPHAIVNTLSK